jgi:hypothetical protein
MICATPDVADISLPGYRMGRTGFPHCAVASHPRYHRRMNSSLNAANARNLLIGAGAFYLSGWLNLLLGIGFDRLIRGALIYHGDFETAVVMPMVEHLPRAIVAAAAGIAVVWLVESRRPTSWVTFPVLLYAVLGFFGYHWGRTPVFLDRVQQTVGALFPAVTCAFGGIVAGWYRTKATHEPSPS